MPKVRAYGADSTLLACRETAYGVAPLAGYRSLDFKSCDLSSEQPLGDDPLLGRGRNAQDPYRGLITDEGRIEIPLDLGGSGFWLTSLFGDPSTTQTKASGQIAFSGQPAANSTSRSTASPGRSSSVRPVVTRRKSVPTSMRH
jgi:hypothetical protein